MHSGQKGKLEAFPGDIFTGGGDMGALMRGLEWSKTPLGPISEWPQSLKTSLSICLASRFPIVLYWGPEYVVLYNDAYSTILGSKHPWALGQRCRDCWAEIWDTIGPMLDEVVRTGEATWSNHLLLQLERFGYPEECYFSFSFSPIRVETGSVGGVFTAVLETTEEVIGERRLHTLRDLAARGVDARSERDAWRIAAATMGENLRDIPFVVLCQPTAEGGLQVVETTGISREHPLCKGLCSPGSRWFAQAREAMDSGSVSVPEFGDLAAELPCGAWQVPPRRGVLIPMATPGQGLPGVLLAGLSPHKELDESYRTFFGLVGRQIATSVADARAYEEERRRAEALAASDTGTYCWDPNSREFLDFDENLKRLFGLAADAPVRVTEDILHYIHADDVPEILAAMERSRQGADWEMEYRVVLPDGRLRWLYDRGKMVFEKGKPAYLVGACTDTTTRKVEESARLKLAAIVESSDDAIVSKDVNGMVTSWNAGAERMFGYKAREIIGRPITTIIPPELHDDEARILKKLRHGERIDHFETVRVTKSGERIDVSLTISPLKDDGGRVIGAAKIARDITQRKKTEEALRMSDKLATTGRLAATVAHEINNPLESVVNLVYLAKSQNGLPENVREYLQAAEEELDRVSQLTRQALGFYREKTAATTIRVGPIISQLRTVFSPKTTNKRIDLQIEVDQDPEIMAVPGELRQLFANLISNSIDAVPLDGTIRVRVSQAQGRDDGGLRGARVTIADSGPGIDAAHRSRIFEPFFTTKKEVGTGLGLWVSKGIVERHGGRIRLRSRTAPGRSGTVFSVFLPANAAEARELRRSNVLKEAV